MGRYRIMIVDDEQEVRQAMIRKLDWEALGFQVVLEAENGQDALEKGRPGGRCAAHCPRRTE